MLFKSFSVALAAIAPLVDAAPPNGLQTRQRPGGCTSTTWQELSGDGSPQQDAYWVQISDNLNCGGSCNIELSQTTSTEVSFSFSGSSDASFISGGFGVSQTRSTGQSQGCEDSGYDRVCMWYEMHHTTYQVQDRRQVCNPQTGNDERVDDEGDPYSMWAPNENNRGGFHCMYDDDCDHEGAYYWEENVASGGPPE